MSTGISDALLRDFAEDAFAVLNWARRLGMRKDQQVEEVAKALRKRLGSEGGPAQTSPLPANSTDDRRADGGADIVMKHTGISA